MKYKFIIFIMFCLYSFSSESIRITNGEWAPYMSEKAPSYGFISKAVTEVFKSENIKVTYGFFPWARSFELAKTNQWDGTIWWAKTKDREEHFIFSKEPLFIGNVVLFYQRPNSLEWDDLSDLKKYTIGITTGYSYGKDFDAFITANPKNFESTFSDLNNFKKLFSGRIHGFAMDLDIGLKILKDNFRESEYSDIMYSTNSIDKRPQYLLLNRNQKNIELMKKFDNGFNQLDAKKTIEKNIKEFRETVLNITK